MKLGNCGRLALSPINAIWFRAIAPRHLATALRTSQSLGVRTRFSPGGMEILYLAENQTTALYEVGAILGPPSRPVANPTRTKFALLDIHVKLHSVADLTDPAQQALINVSLQELTGEWDPYTDEDAPTQKLGSALFAAKKIEGFLAPSAPASLNKNLIVFPQKLLKGSELVFEDTSPSGTVHRING